MACSTASSSTASSQVNFEFYLGNSKSLLDDNVFNTRHEPYRKYVSHIYVCTGDTILLSASTLKCDRKGRLTSSLSIPIEVAKTMEMSVRITEYGRSMYNHQSDCTDLSAKKPKFVAGKTYYVMIENDPKSGSIDLRLSFSKTPPETTDRE